MDVLLLLIPVAMIEVVRMSRSAEAPETAATAAGNAYTLLMSVPRKE